MVVEDKEILGFLPLLDETQLREEKILLAEDMIFLSKVVRFGLELLVRQRFLPYLRYTEDKRLICHWQPVFISEEEERLFSHLKAEVPDSVRCIKGLIPSRERLILHLLTFLIDHTIKDSIGYDLRSSLSQILVKEKVGRWMPQGRIFFIPSLSSGHPLLRQGLREKGLEHVFGLRRQRITTSRGT